MRSDRWRRPRAEWEALVREWRSGGLTQREFARRKGIAPTTLSWWSCRVAREGRRGAELVPVEVIGGGGGDFRVELRGGRMVYVPAGFDEDALRRLLGVLEHAAC
jgi:hypothetical protein